MWHPRSRWFSILSSLSVLGSSVFTVGCISPSCHLVCGSGFQAVFQTNRSIGCNVKPEPSEPPESEGVISALQPLILAELRRFMQGLMCPSVCVCVRLTQTAWIKRLVKNRHEEKRNRKWWRTRRGRKVDGTKVEEMRGNSYNNEGKRKRYKKKREESLVFPDS